MMDLIRQTDFTGGLWVSTVIATIISVSVTLLITFIKMFYDRRILHLQHQHELYKLKQEHKTNLEVIQNEKKAAFNLELDKMKARSLQLLYKPLKYASERSQNPNAMFLYKKVGNEKQFILLKSKGEAFLKGVDEYLWSEYGQLFLPKELRKKLFKLRGIVNDVIVFDENPPEEIVIKKAKIVDQIKALLHGENDIHAELRKALTID